MPRMYELVEEVRQVLAAIDENGGEMTDEQERILAEAYPAIEDKAEAYAAIIKEFEHDMDAIQIEIGRMQRRKKSLEQAADRLREVLRVSMIVAQIDTCKGLRFTVSLSKASRPTIKWTLKDQEPPEGFRKIEVKPDNDAAYQAWKRNELPEGFEAHLKQGITIR